MPSTGIKNYVQTLYQNVLMRNADSGGAGDWVAKAEAGLTSADMVRSFVTSAEAQKITALLRLYDVFFNRAADVHGLSFWLSQQRNGLATQDIATSFANSSEFKVRYGAASTGEYVDALYSNLFDRASDPAGKAHWVNVIDSGTMTRAEVAVQFAFSSEAVSSASAATRFAESYLVLRASGMQEPTTEVVDAIAKKSLTDAVTELQTIKGVVQNGIIQNASVYRDADGDGMPDSGAKPAFTDADGKFTIVGGYGDIVVTGGNDLTTGKANDKVLATPGTRIINSGSDLAGEVMVTPLTAIVTAIAGQGVSMEDAIRTVKLALGLDADINPLTFNHTMAAIAPGASDATLKAAVAVKGAVAQLTAIMENAAGVVKGAAGTGASVNTIAVTTHVASALADKFIAATRNITTPQSAPLVALDAKDLIKDIIDATTAKASASATAPISRETVAKVGTLAADVAQVIGALNAAIKAGVAAINDTSTFDATKVVDAFSTIAKAEALAQDTVQEAITSAAAGGSMSAVVTSYTGLNLSTAIRAAAIGKIADGVDSTSGGTIIAQATAGSDATTGGSGGSSGGSSGGGISAFRVTESSAGSRIWTPSIGNGNVVVTESGSNYVFTPATGTAVSVAKANLNELVVSTISLSGAAAVLKSIKKITGAVTVTDTGAVTAADLKTIQAAASGLVTATSVTSTSGTAADAKLLVATNEGTNGDKIDMKSDVAVTLTDITATLADLKAIEGATTGLVTATTVTSTSGSAADAKLLLVTNEGATGNKIDMKSDVAVTLTDTTVTLSDLKAIEAAASGLVTATTVTSISGSMVDAQLLLITNKGTSGDKINMRADVAVTLSDTTATLADLKLIKAATTGLVTATAVATTSGSAADAKLLLVTNEGTSGNKIDMKADVAVTLSDTTVTLADLKAIEGATVGLVTATAVASTGGSAADAKMVLVTSEGTSGDKIDMKSDVAVTLTDITATLADLKAIEGATTGLVTATTVTSTSGSVADAKLLLITNKGNTGDKIDLRADVALTLTDVGTVADTDDILNATTGVITTRALVAGTYANFATGDKIATALTFSAGSSGAGAMLPAAHAATLNWVFDTNTATLKYETADDGLAPVSVALVLTGIASVTETAGVFTLTHV